METIQVQTILDNLQDFVGKTCRVSGLLLAADQEQRLVGGKYQDFPQGLKIEHENLMNYLASKLEPMGGGDYYFKLSSTFLGRLVMESSDVEPRLTALRVADFPDVDQQIDFTQPAPRNNFHMDAETIAKLSAMTDEILLNEPEEE